ncbi:hypothetical protein AVEN_180329-1 [Araneus ventricosus]|uniref:Uncharacterized protein n=1 Tax=Araneus ventricosus TaxID=182803 RepID=A0A4Y2V070_ARAVE|nr:hypothetical protein AVEN_180329-1 [Araneus ventricosus]
MSHLTYPRNYVHFPPNKKPLGQPGATLWQTPDRLFQPKLHTLPGGQVPDDRGPPDDHWRLLSPSDWMFTPKRLPADHLPDRRTGTKD